MARRPEAATSVGFSRVLRAARCAARPELLLVAQSVHNECRARGIDRMVPCCVCARAGRRDIKPDVRGILESTVHSMWMESTVHSMWRACGKYSPQYVEGMQLAALLCCLASFSGVFMPAQPRAGWVSHVPALCHSGARDN